MRIDGYPSGLQGSMHAFDLVPEGICLGMELGVGRLFELLLELQLPVQRPLRQKQMFRQRIDSQRNRQNTGRRKSGESIMVIGRELDVQIERAVDKHESPFYQFDGVNDPLVVLYCNDR